MLSISWGNNEKVSMKNYYNKKEKLWYDKSSRHDSNLQRL